MRQKATAASYGPAGRNVSDHRGCSHTADKPNRTSCRGTTPMFPDGRAADGADKADNLRGAEMLDSPGGGQPAVTPRYICCVWLCWQKMKKASAPPSAAFLLPVPL